MPCSLCLCVHIALCLCVFVYAFSCIRHDTYLRRHGSCTHELPCEWQIFNTHALHYVATSYKQFFKNNSTVSPASVASRGNSLDASYSSPQSYTSCGHGPKNPPCGPPRQQQPCPSPAKSLSHYSPPSRVDLHGWWSLPRQQKHPWNPYVSGMPPI